MPIILIFIVLVCSVTGYAISRGGAPERAAAAMLIVALIASQAVTLLPHRAFTSVERPLLAIDTTLFVGAFALALLADRFWTLWFAALQLIIVATHAIRAIDPHVVPLAYWSIESRLGYPMLLVLLIGTFRHARRCAGGERDVAWSFQRHERGPDLPPA